MKRKDNLSVGWLNTSIGTLLENQDAMFAVYAYALITRVDSATDLRQVLTSRAIIERYPACRYLGAGLVIPAGALPEVGKEFNLFNGFDEAWWFTLEPELPKPDEVFLVAPLDLRADAVCEQLRDWMRVSGCELGLGDGIGLNYVAVDESVALALEQSASQLE
jgi:hypothetical protein